MSEMTLDSTPWVITTRGGHGAASELRAGAELIDAGYYVFRAESPHSPFDLVAYKDGKMFRVEVKSVTENPNEQYDCAPGFTWPRNDEWDMLMVIGTDRVLCFDAGTTQADASDALRVAYGFSPRKQGGMPGAKLNGHTADIKRRADAGERVADLAQEFDVCLSTIYNVLNGKSYQNAL